MEQSIFIPFLENTHTVGNAVGFSPCPPLITFHLCTSMSQPRTVQKGRDHAEQQSGPRKEMVHRRAIVEMSFREVRGVQLLMLDVQVRKGDVFSAYSGFAVLMTQV